jgi:glycogen operon protein
VQQLIAFRKQHPSIARSRFWREDIQWYGPDGVVDFARPAVAWCLRGDSRGDRDLYVMVNAGDRPASFVLQDVGPRPWRVVVDTARPSPGDVELDDPKLLDRPSYAVGAHSVVVLVR